MQSPIVLHIRSQSRQRPKQQLRCLSRHRSRQSTKTQSCSCRPPTYTQQGPCASPYPLAMLCRRPCLVRHLPAPASAGLPPQPLLALAAVHHWCPPQALAGSPLWKAASLRHQERLHGSGAAAGLPLAARPGVGERPSNCTAPLLQQHGSLWHQIMKCVSLSSLELAQLYDSLTMLRTASCMNQGSRLWSCCGCSGSARGGAYH